MRPFISPMLLGSAGLTPGTFLVGNNAAQTTATGTAADFQVGIIAQALVSGMAGNIVIVGNLAITGTFRLTVYAATNASTISGTLLGKSADQSGIAAGINSYPLVAPVSIVSGNWYALMIHGGTISGGTASNGTLNDRFFSDAYSDGPLATAPASGLNSSNGRMIYLTV